MKPFVVFDLDGTLFRGTEVIPGAVEAVCRLRGAGFAIRFLTNNSGATRAMLTEKLASMGFEPEPNEVYGTAMAAACEAMDVGWKRVFVVGEPGLHETLKSFGIEPVEERPDGVIVGICRTFSYKLLNQALQHILAGAPFWATNRDATYPLPGGCLEPGAGAMVAAVEAASGVKPRVLGKPEPAIIENMLRDETWSPAATWIVGDRLETDIACGEAAGCHTWLVLTGAATEIPEGQEGSADLNGLVDELIG